LLIFDGLQIPLNSETEKYSTPENFKILSSIIENETGFNLEIVKKPFDDRLDLSLEIEEEEDNDDVFILDDGDAAERIISKFAECMINCNNVRYVKNEVQEDVISNGKGCKMLKQLASRGLFLELKDDNIKILLDKSEMIDAFTIYVLNHFADSMVTPDSVQFCTEDMLQDIPLTLEHIVLQHFRHSTNNSDELFTDEIIEKIRETEFEGTVGTKELQAISLKCGVGCRASNGKITIDGRK